MFPPVALRTFLSFGRSRSKSTSATASLPPTPSTPIAKTREPTVRRLSDRCSKGQNLCDRYVKLESSVRNKPPTQSRNTDRSQTKFLKTNSPPPSSAKPDESVSLFYGLRVPKEPESPADDLCCMSGCASCVFDVYQEALAQYQESISVFRTSLAALKIPEDEWPNHIKANPDAGHVVPARKQQNTVLATFEALERALASRKEIPIPT